MQSSGICPVFPAKSGQWKSSPLWQSWKQRCLCPLRAWCSSWALHRWHSPARCCWCRQYRCADPVSVPDGGLPDVRPYAGRVAESGSGHCHAHQCGADERDSGRSPADRQRAADQSGLRYRVRPCGLCLQLRRDGAAGCLLYCKAGRGHGTGGPSGGGKTTVSRLAARFWDYQKGSITVGGMEVSRIDPEKLMSLYSIVFQDVTLFDNTILENIRLGRKARPMRRSLQRQSWQTARNLPKSCRTSGTPTSGKTAAPFPAASVSAFPLPAPS